MSADDRHRVCNSSEDHPFRRKNGLIQLPCEGRAVNAGDADGSVPSPSGLLNLAYFVVPSVNVITHADELRSFPYARRFAGVHQESRSPVNFAARCGGSQGPLLKNERTVV